MRTVIRVTGTYANGLEFTTRYWFYRGKSLVRIFHTLENNNTCPFSEEIGRPNCFDVRLNNGAAYGQVDLEDLSLALTPSVGSAPVVAAEGRNLPLTTDLSLYQDSSGTRFWNLYSRLLRGAPLEPRMQAYTSFRGFRLLVGAETLATGDHSAGVLGLSGASGGVTLAVRNFWQNFPKALRTRAG
ncbi:MAG: hypothetical protein HY343_06995, partial [Lentisphaerae bacterium]|nr:hypothetical protein [Lentisphaerota bacterium]